MAVLYAYDDVGKGDYAKRLRITGTLKLHPHDTVFGVALLRDNQTIVKCWNIEPSSVLFTLTIEEFIAQGTAAPASFCLWVNCHQDAVKSASLSVSRVT